VKHFGLSHVLNDCSANKMSDGERSAERRSLTRDDSPDRRIRSQESRIKTYDPEFAVGKRRADIKGYVQDWEAGWERSKPNGD
jgi:hypothetical protein